MVRSVSRPPGVPSVPRPGRSALAALLLCAVLGVPLASGCGPASGSAKPPGGPAVASGAPSVPGTDGGGATTQGGTRWALTAPQVAAGHPQGQPPADMVQRFDADMRRNAGRLSVSGAPVRAYYDDRADGAWIFYTGVTGSGFDPDHLHDALNQLPAAHDDGAGDHVTTSAIDTEPGPHGGRAICDTVLVQSGVLTTAVSTCSWFTATTAAGVTVIPKTDGTGTRLGYTAADVAPIMRAVRAEVETPRR